MDKVFSESDFLSGKKKKKTLPSKFFVIKSQSMKTRKVAVDPFKQPRHLICHVRKSKYRKCL